MAPKYPKETYLAALNRHFNGSGAILLALAHALRQFRRGGVLQVAQRRGAVP